MAYLGKYWKKYKWLFILSVACVSCEALCDLLQPKVMSKLIDEGAAKGDLAYVLRMGLLMLSIVGAGAAMALLRNVVSSKASQGFGADLRQELFLKIQSMPLAEIDTFEGGSLVTRLTSDVTQMQNFINGTMRIFFKAPVMCIGGIFMAATLDLKTLPIILPIVILVFFVISISMKLAYPRFARVQQALDKLNTTMREYLAGIRLVKAFRRFDEEEKRFGSANEALTDNTIRASRTLAIFSPFMSLFVNLGIAIMLYFGSRWVGDGQMQVGQVMAFVTYMAQILTSLNMISNVMNMFVRVKTSNERIVQVMDASAEELTPGGATAQGGGAVGIRFEDVGFSYLGSTGEPALRELSFEIAAGETLAVIGPTGSGKSTLAALLMRFYDPTQGRIFIDGKPLLQIPGDAWRNIIALVPQTAMLFTGSIRDNILWGKEDATEEEIQAASQAAQAHEFILAQSGGYDTAIGQSGVNLSGGQKQRVSIARALVRSPRALVLDDCTSALDVITEAKVKRALRNLSMTCVLVTQRISTAMSCDKILVLENGMKVGLGTHEELMESCPEYRDIYRSQIGKEVG